MSHPNVHPYVDAATYIELRLDEDRKIIDDIIIRNLRSGYAGYATPELHMDTLAYWVREHVINRRARAYLEQHRA